MSCETLHLHLERLSGSAVPAGRSSCRSSFQAQQLRAQEPSLLCRDSCTVPGSILVQGQPCQAGHVVLRGRYVIMPA